MRARMIVSEAVRSLRASASTTVAATMTVLIGMFLVGLLIAFGTFARSWSDQQKDKLLLEVFYCVDTTCGEEATASQIDAVRIKLESSPLVKEVRFVSKDEALQRMSKRDPELVRGIPFNPLPVSHEVVPLKGEYVEKIDESLRPLPAGVEKITYGKKTASRVLRVARLIETIFSAAILVLLVASALLIANTIRLSIFARRREIEVMKLVGASNWFVRGPFMVEGLMCGLIGALSAVLLLVLGRAFVLPEIGWLDEPGVRAIDFYLNALILIGIGLLLGATGSAFTLRRFLRV